MEIDAGKERGLTAALPAALKQALHIPFRHLWKFVRIGPEESQLPTLLQCDVAPPH